MVDIRYEDQVVKAMEEGAKKFGGIDILVKLLVSICWILFYNWVIYFMMQVNNASAISL